MKRVVIGQCQKAPNFSAFHWSLYSSLVSIGQHAFRKYEGSTFTEKDLFNELDRAKSKILPTCISFYTKRACEHTTLNQHCVKVDST